MGKLCTIGFDIAKNYFQVHGEDARGNIVLKKKLTREKVVEFFANIPQCVVGIEACAGAHHWARTLLELGHEPKLIPPRLVKPFVVNNKTDAADAAAICEVVRRPSTKFVSIKSEVQQAMASLHCIRERRIANRTALINQVRGLLGEIGLVFKQGLKNIVHELPLLTDSLDTRLPGNFKRIFQGLYEEFKILNEQIATIEHEINEKAKIDENCQRLMKVPGVGILTATAVVAHFSDARQFKNGRQFAACIGLTPREYSSGGKQNLGGISKRGNKYIRKLLIQGARVIRRMWCSSEAQEHETRKIWLQGVNERRGKFVASVAQANKTARIVWNVLAKGEEYKEVIQVA